MVDGSVRHHPRRGCSASSLLGGPVLARKSTREALGARTGAEGAERAASARESQRTATNADASGGHQTYAPVGSVLARRRLASSTRRGLHVTRFQEAVRLASFALTRPRGGFVGRDFSATANESLRGSSEAPSQASQAAARPATSASPPRGRRSGRAHMAGKLIAPPSCRNDKLLAQQDVLRQRLPMQAQQVSGQVANDRAGRGRSASRTAPAKTAWKARRQTRLSRRR